METFQCYCLFKAQRFGSPEFNAFQQKFIVTELGEHPKKNISAINKRSGFQTNNMDRYANPYAHEAMVGKGWLISSVYDIIPWVPTFSYLRSTQTKTNKR